MQQPGLPDWEKRVIAVIAAMRHATGFEIQTYIDRELDLPESPGVYMFGFEPSNDPGEAGPFAECDNWFNTRVALYVGLADPKTLRQRLEAHIPKWEEVLSDGHRKELEAFGVAYDHRHLFLSYVTYEVEAPVAEETLLKQVTPIAAKPFLTRGGFGRDYAPGQHWTLLGETTVKDSLPLAKRLDRIRGHTAPFLTHKELLEEFNRDRYYENFGITPGG